MHKRIALTLVVSSRTGGRGSGCQAGGRLQRQDHHHQEAPTDEVLIAGGLRQRASEQQDRQDSADRREGGGPGELAARVPGVLRAAPDRQRDPIKFYDITGGEKRYVAGDPQYTREKGSRIFGSSITLDKPAFDVRKHYLMNIDSRGRTIATTTFWLLGKGAQYSGKVEFSDADTRAK